RWIGLAEMRFAAGQTQAALDALKRANKAASQLLCLRALTIQASQPRALRETLKDVQAPGNWAHLALLYLALQEHDRPALLRMAGIVGEHQPGGFATTQAEKYHIELLVELGMTRAQAALDVLGARSTAALHVLRDLDQGLTREIAFYQQGGTEAQAK